MKKRKEAFVYYLILYCALAVTTAVFYIPTIQNYLTGESWIKTDVKHQKNDHANMDSNYVYNNTQTAYLSREWSQQISFKPHTPASVYVISFHIINLILLFTGIWYFTKIVIGFRSEIRLEESTLKWISGLGKILIIWWLLAFAHDLFMRYYLLKAIGFEGYKTSERQSAFLIVGFILIYFASVYKKGLLLQQENDLTV